jgi:hypothetical protein
MVLRHPCAVAASRMKLKWDSHLEEFLAQKELMDDFLNPFKSEIENLKTDFEKYIMLWCIENYVPLRQFKPGQMHFVFYENFCIHPEKEIDGLFDFLGKKYTSKIFKVARIPSGTARKVSAIYSKENPTESYKKTLTPQQIQRAVELLKTFGLDKIYGPEPMPLVNGKEVFLEES